MSKYNPEFTGNTEHTSATDALNRALTCADAINHLLVDSFCDVKQGEIGLSNEVTASALWAIDGFIREANQLSDLIYKEGFDAGKAVTS